MDNRQVSLLSSIYKQDIPLQKYSKAIKDTIVLCPPCGYQVNTCVQVIIFTKNIVIDIDFGALHIFENTLQLCNQEAKALTKRYFVPCGALS